MQAPRPGEGLAEGRGPGGAAGRRRLLRGRAQRQDPPRARSEESQQRPRVFRRDRPGLAGTGARGGNPALAGLERRGRLPGRARGGGGAPPGQEGHVVPTIWGRGDDFRGV